MDSVLIIIAVSIVISAGAAVLINKIEKTENKIMHILEKVDGQSKENTARLEHLDDKLKKRW